MEAHAIDCLYDPGFGVEVGLEIPNL